MIRTMKIEDYSQMIHLWSHTEGIGLNEADTEEKIQVFLERNKLLSFVAVSKDKIVGTIMCGHDGRRGYLYHLAVAAESRKQGIGKKLIEVGVNALKIQGIEKCHLFVIKKNNQGRHFWNRNQWKEREDLIICSKDI